MFADLDDATLDALFAGHATGDAGLVSVEDLVRALRSRAGAEPAPVMSSALRAQLRTASIVPLDARRRIHWSAGKGVAAAAAVAVVALTGTAAAQNRLPAQLQDVVSSTADVLGVDVPRSDERIHTADDHETPDPDGYDGTTTPGGATPAEPKGSGEPATPATPPDNPGEQAPPTSLPEQANEDPGQPDEPGQEGQDQRAADDLNAHLSAKDTQRP